MYNEFFGAFLLQATMKKVKKNVPLDFENYVNIETGETLVSELISATDKFMISVKEDTELFTMKQFENFAVINTDTLSKVAKLLNNADLGHLLKLFPLTKTELNMLYNNTIPHSNATLQKYLEIGSRAKFTELIKRLMKAGVLYQIKGNIRGSIRVVYIMNPYLSNRRKTFHLSLYDIFKDFNT